MQWGMSALNHARNLTKMRKLSDQRFWKGCECWTEQEQPPPFFRSDEDFQGALAALSHLPNLPDNPPPVDDGGDLTAAQCNSSNENDNLVSMDKGFFTRYADV